jgi:hypothetical protein
MVENVMIKKFGTSRTQSCFELQARHEDCADELRSLIMDWKTQYTEKPTFSPKSFRRDRMSVRAVIDTLTTRLPIIRSPAIQSLLHEIYILVLDRCSTRERNQLELIIIRQSIVEDPLEVKFKTGVTDEELVAIPLRFWNAKYIDILLLEGEPKSLRHHIRRRSKLLIKLWLPLEEIECPLRLNSPLRLLLRCWINNSWVITEHDLTSVNACLGLITTLPERTRSILRFVSREFVEMGMEPRQTIGTLMIHFIYFSCLMPLITDNVRRRSLHEQFRSLPITDAFSTVARWSIFQ